jgi:hypothetical protein
MNPITLFATGVFTGLLMGISFVFALAFLGEKSVEGTWPKPSMGGNRRW